MHEHTPALLDFLNKTSSSLKEALEMNTPSEPDHQSCPPKMSLKISLRNSLHANTTLTTLNSPPSPFPPSLPEPIAEVYTDPTMPHNVMMITPEASSSLAPSEAPYEPYDAEIPFSYYDIVPIRSSPSFAMLNVPVAKKVNPDNQDSWFSGEVRAYYAL